MSTSYETIKNLLRTDKGKTTQDLSDISGFKVRTVRYALKSLKRRGFVTEKLFTRDMRKIVYFKKEAKKHG